MCDKEAGISCTEQRTEAVGLLSTRELGHEQGECHQQPPVFYYVWRCVFGGLCTPGTDFTANLIFHGGLSPSAMSYCEDSVNIKPTFFKHSIVSEFLDIGGDSITDYNIQYQKMLFNSIALC